ncbi:hypothetical protein EXE58_00685 [Nocardioides seonyuensis]|uniref:Spondin domain-containing protein n=1 Tax=Nocardioides seonyuensis TaxID=2518371 RepID=A0A4V1BLU9_9ACTN|nr:hypothetical protein [Nocardioides seonyuensis]QBX54132.1 hypothetical protein EXE58_00685 [Nocardioides seonyuensis]
MDFRKLRVLVSGVALLGAASITTVTSASAAETSASSSAATVEVSISKTHAVTLPTTLQPGVNEFRVTTEAKRSGFQLAQLADGYTLDQAIADIDNGLNKGKVKPFKRFEANVTLLGGVTVMPGTVGKVTLDLPAGTYYATDIEKNKASAFTQFTVAGADAGGTMPSGATIRATKKATWAKNPKTIDRKGMLTFENFSSANHFVGLMRLKKGKTVKDFRRWVEATMNGEQGPPPVRFDGAYDSGVVSPGHTVAMNYKLPKGDYVLACFWPDADMGGMPHAFMGMYRAIRLR